MLNWEYKIQVRNDCQKLTVSIQQNMFYILCKWKLWYWKLESCYPLFRRHYEFPYLYLFYRFQFNKCVLHWLFKQFIWSILTVYVIWWFYNTFQSKGNISNWTHPAHGDTGHIQMGIDKRRGGDCWYFVLI